MKISKTVILLILIILLYPKTVFCASNYVVYGEYTVNSLKITSYSPSWTSSKLKGLYEELLNNFYGEEFPYLGEIKLYPNSPDGVNGYYFQDISLNNGKYVAGSNALIELYNCERYNTVEAIAPNLSHEYGHHYMTVNILLSEGKLYNTPNQTKYYEIRSLGKYPVVYSYSDPNYSYVWDIAEIMASDYVQLLGSPNAKRSIDYPDSAEKVILNETNTVNFTEGFNMRPQINPILPLASEVKGLYSYMLNISGYTSEKTDILKAPEITSIYKSLISSIDENQYAVYWNRAIGNSPFEYTVVMYPSNNPFTPIPIRTVNDDETLKALFGSAVLNLSDGEKRIYSSKYSGKYVFKVYAKDSKGFIYASEPYYYDFDSAPMQTQGPSKNVVNSPLDNIIKGYGGN